MKALTLTQPWATLVAVGAKRIETRSWRTAHRGPLAIHAAKETRTARNLAVQEPFFTLLGRGFGQLPYGAVVATCTLVGCYPIYAERRRVGGLVIGGHSAFIVLPPDEPERSFGDYTPGRYAWLLADIKPLAEPMAAKGSLGLWEWKS